MGGFRNNTLKCEESRKREKLACDAAAAGASDNPAGSSGAGMTLMSCPA